MPQDEKAKTAASGTEHPSFPAPAAGAVVWVLLTVALAAFSALILLLTLDANRQSIDNALRAEARLATVNLRRELSPIPPYWPDQLTLNIVDIYHDSGVIVEVQDAQGQVRYLSSSGTASMMPTEPEAIRTALAGQVSWYGAQANSEHIGVEVVPVRAPDATPRKSRQCAH